MSHTWPIDMFLAALTAILKRASRLVNMVSTLVSGDVFTFMALKMGLIDSALTDP